MVASTAPGRARSPRWLAASRGVVVLALLAPCQSPRLVRWQQRAELVLRHAERARAQAQVRAGARPDPSFPGAHELK